MVDALLRFATHRRWLVLGSALVVAALGLHEAQRMSVDVFPDLSAPRVTLVTEAPGMAPEDVEQLVTFPIEAAVGGISGVRRVRSASASGISIVWVEFDWETEDRVARQRVTERIAGLSELAPGAEAPTLAPQSSVMGEIAFVTLTANGNTGNESGDATGGEGDTERTPLYANRSEDIQGALHLRRIAEVQVRRRLLSIRGIAQVVALGGLEREYQVITQPARLAAYRLTLEDVAEAIRRGNTNAPGGYVVAGGQESQLRIFGRAHNTNDLSDILVASRGETPVYVRDVAQVRIGAGVPRGAGSYNGQPAVVFSIVKQPGADTLAVTAAVDAALDELSPTLDTQGLALHRDLFRQGDFIQTAVSNVMAVLRDGAFLVMLVLLLFLWSPRPAFISVVALPLSLLLSVLALKLLGYRLDTMTLGGLAIAIGELVDDAIVDVENVVRHLRQRALLPIEQRPAIATTVLEASREIRGAIVSATAILMVVFVPLLLLEGLEGRLLMPLGVAYLVAIASSLLVAITVTPALCVVLLGQEPKAKSKEGQTNEEPNRPGKLATEEINTEEINAEEREEPTEKVPPLLAPLLRVYTPALRYAMARPKTMALGSLAMAIGGAFALADAGRSFLPEFNEGSLTIAAVTLPGTPLSTSDALGRLAERTLLADPAVLSTARRTGRAERDEHVQGVEAAEIDVRLQEDPRDKETLLADLRRRLSVVPGMRFTLGQPISHRIDHMLSGQRTALSIKVFGTDLRQIRRQAERIRATIEDVEGLVDLSVEQSVDVPQLEVRSDTAAAARYGLSPGQGSRLAGDALWGTQAGVIYEDNTTTPIVVRYDDATRASPQAVAATRVPTPSGALAPLHALATIEENRAPNYILRENVERRIVVTANAAGRDLRSVYEDVRERVGAIPLPAGVRVAYAGQFEREEAARQRLLAASILALIAILVILLSTLRSLRRSLIVLTNLPLALAGGAVGVYLSGGILSVASLIGFITLFGIATRNGVLLATRTRDLEGEGLPRADAVVQGAKERLSPILMTAVTAGVGLLPLALALGQPGSEIQAPMAWVILTGLVTATSLNMLVVPSLLARWGGEDRRERED